MRIRNIQQMHRRADRPEKMRGRGLLSGRGAALMVTLLLAMLTTYKLSSQQRDPAPPANPNQTASDANQTASAAGHVPAGNTEAATHEESSKPSADSASLDRKRQITDDSARLLKLASDLRTEVDKTNKDTLSIGVIRKADEIEKLARNVKEKMKLAMSTN